MRNSQLDSGIKAALNIILFSPLLEFIHAYNFYNPRPRELRDRLTKTKYSLTVLERELRTKRDAICLVGYLGK